jgi:hypothetical protein
MAVMASPDVVVVKCDAYRNVDVADLRGQSQGKHKDKLRCASWSPTRFTHGRVRGRLLHLRDHHENGGQGLHGRREHERPGWPLAGRARHRPMFAI